MSDTISNAELVAMGKEQAVAYLKQLGYSSKEACNKFDNAIIQCSQLDPLVDVSQFSGKQYVVELPTGFKFTVLLPNGWKDIKDGTPVNMPEKLQEAIRKEGYENVHYANGKIQMDVIGEPNKVADAKIPTAEVAQNSSAKKKSDKPDPLGLGDYKTLNKNLIGMAGSAVAGGVAANPVSAVVSLVVGLVGCNLNFEDNKYQSATITVDYSFIIEKLNEIINGNRQNKQDLIDALNKNVADLMKSDNENKNAIIDAIEALMAAVNSNASKLDLSLAGLNLLLTENNTDNKRRDEALEAIKASSEANGEKLDDILTAIRTINTVLANLPDNIKAKFQEDILTIIESIATNNRLTAANGKTLAKILFEAKCINKNMINGFGIVFAKLDKVNGGIERVINTICQLDANQEDRNNRVITAMCDGFNTLIDLGVDGFNRLLEQGNQTNSLLDNIKCIASAIGIDVRQGNEAIFRELQNHGVTLNALYAGLSVVNDNIVQSNANETALLTAIIENMPQGKCPNYTCLLQNILRSIPKSVNAIISAINNKDVIITIDNNGNCHCQDKNGCKPGEGKSAHEGVLNDLEALLG